MFDNTTIYTKYRKIACVFIKDLSYIPSRSDVHSRIESTCINLCVYLSASANSSSWIYLHKKNHVNAQRIFMHLNLATYVVQQHTVSYNFTQCIIVFYCQCIVCSYHSFTWGFYTAEATRTSIGDMLNSGYCWCTRCRDTWTLNMLIWDVSVTSNQHTLNYTTTH